MEVLELTEKEMIKISIEEFARPQKYMRMSDKESDVYKEMRERYKELKVILTVSGVNLSEFDFIIE